MTYRIVSILKSFHPYEDLKTLEEMVNGYMQGGFIPIGNLVVDNKCYLQAMIYKGKIK